MEVGVSPSEVREGCFLGGNANELLRKLMNEVFPEFFAPMTRMLEVR